MIEAKDAAACYGVLRRDGQWPAVHLKDGSDWTIENPWTITDIPDSTRLLCAMKPGELVCMVLLCPYTGKPIQGFEA